MSVVEGTIEILQLGDASGVADDDYVHISGTTNGDRKYKAKYFTEAAPTLIEKSITENGVYNASSDSADGYSKVTVNVSGGSSDYNLSYPYTTANQYSMSFGWSETGKFNVIWDGGSNIGNGMWSIFKLNGLSKVVIDIDEIGNSYNRANGLDNVLWKPLLILTNQKITDYISNLSSNTIIDYDVCEAVTLYGQSYHKEIDISEVTGDIFVNFQASGCSLTGVRISAQ